MKRVFVFLVFIMISLSINGQFLKGNPLYVAFGMNFGNYFASNFELNYIVRDKYVFQIAQTSSFRVAKSEPDDFTSPTIYLILPLSFGKAYDQLESIHLMAGRVVNLKDYARLKLMVGLGPVKIEEPINWEYLGPSRTTNYSFDYEKDYRLGLVIKPSIESHVGKVFGVSFNAIMILTNKRIMGGVGLDFVVGRLYRSNTLNEKLFKD